MLTIIQSNKIETLFDELLKLYQQKADTKSVFEPFNVIVPSKVMGEWLKKQVADQAGISTLVTTEFWGRYVLGLMQRVLRIYKYYRDDILDVPDVAMLSKNVMQWQIFGLIMTTQEQIASDSSHPLYEFVAPLVLDDQDSQSSQNSQKLSNTPSQSEAMPFLANVSMLGNQVQTDNAQLHSLEQRFWQLSGDMATMLNRYMTYRPDWLRAWGENKPIAIAEMIAEKDALHNRLHGRGEDNWVSTPEWLVEHYTQLEIAQRYLWLTLFEQDYRYRQTLHQQFWQAFSESDKQIALRCQKQLPKQVILFTLQQLPPSELLELQRLGELTDVRLLHFNPSEQFWADIVDKNWLLEQQIDNPESIYLKDYGHTLLSRFGKQSREVFAMLANLSGNVYNTVRWEDRFVEDAQPNTLLAHLQQDILRLEESDETRQKISELITLTPKPNPANSINLSATSNTTDTPQDSPQFLDQKLIQALTAKTNSTSTNDAMLTLLKKLEAEYQQQHGKARHWQSHQGIDISLSIQVCHSTARQLEVLRNMLVGWLNYTDKQTDHHIFDPASLEPRSLSDILVLVPDIDAQQNTIESIFPKGLGADGYELPARVTGVIGKDINQLWQAITGYYRLLGRAGARFSRVEVFDWLMLPPLYQSFGLNLEQMSRGCELLEAAGFVRGFDEVHLQQTLHVSDDDYRYSFAYALERLVAGVIMPKATAATFGKLVNQYGDVERVKPLSQVSMNDAPIVAVLCQIYQTLNDNRWASERSQTVEAWLSEIEQLIQQRFAIFNQTNAWLAIFNAQNDLKNHLLAHHKSPTMPQLDKSLSVTTNTDALPLKLNFVLESIAEQLVSQQVSAEPSGVITFARVGAVRNLPYKLIVMLNMNLSDFPKREQQNRYNLMQAGLPKRGDRFREDDDLGAFLDGLLCAKEACWLFYNGKSTTDTYEHLPASPVQELLSFLQTEVYWENDPAFITQSPADGSDPSSMPDRQGMGQQIEQYLVTHHPALPFDKGYFVVQTDQPEQENLDKIAEDETNDATDDVDDDTHDDLAFNDDTTDLPYSQQLTIAKSIMYPPATIWQGLYQQLEQSKQHKLNQPLLDRVVIWQRSELTQWLDAWQHKKSALTVKQTDSVNTDNQLNHGIIGEQQYHNLNLIIRDLQKPAYHFINAQRLYLNAEIDDSSELEALTLNHLTNYELVADMLEHKLNDEAQNDNSQLLNDTFLLSEKLPAGVNRYQSYQQVLSYVEADIEQFFDVLNEISHGDCSSVSSSLTISHLAISHLTKSLDGLIKSQGKKQGVKQSKALTTSDKLAIVTQLLTSSQEQLVPITMPKLDNVWQQDKSSLMSGSDKTDKAAIAETIQTIVLTAQLPNQISTDLSSKQQPAKFWLRYLPNTGDDKYQVQFWLNHLCWQVARHTSTQQVASHDGFSLWQYKKHLWYLPAIEWQQAYSWLQDWLAVWQLSESQLMILPPKVVINYLTPAKSKDKAETELQPSRELKDWKFVEYNQAARDTNYFHPSWQMLLSDKKPQVIEPFITTLGEYLYQPMLTTMQEIAKP